MRDKNFLVLTAYRTISEVLKNDDFSAPTARYMFRLIKQVGLDWNNMLFETLCPTEDEFLNLGDKALDKMLQTIQDKKATTVLLLGEELLQLFMPDSKLNDYRGSLLDDLAADCIIVPTFHYEDIFKKGWGKSGSGTAMGGTIFGQDLMKAWRVYVNGHKATMEKFNLEPTVDDIEQFINDIIEKNKTTPTRLYADTEGDGLSRENTTMCVLGLATDDETCIVIPFKTLHGTDYFNLHDEMKVRKLLKKLFNSGVQIVWQNGYCYDLPVMENDKNALPIPFKAFGGDTLLMHHALDPEAAHNIGYIASLYADTKYWKESFLQKGESIYETDQLEMRRYNARDCVVLSQITRNLERKLHQEGLWNIYQDSIAMTEVTMQMVRNGIPLSRPRLRTWQAKLSKRLVQAEKDVKALYNWGDEVNLASGDHLRYILFGSIPGSVKTAQKTLEEYLPWTQFRVACSQGCGSKKWLSYKDSKLAEAGQTVFTLKCPRCKKPVQYKTTGETQAGKLKDKSSKKYKDALNRVKLLTIKRPAGLRNFRPRKTDENLPSTNAKMRVSYTLAINKRLEAIEGLKRKTQSHIEEEKGLRDLLNFLTVFNHWAVEAKLKSTYSQFHTWNDGRIHPKIYVHGTSTSRLSSAGPNVQNFPTLDKEPDLRKLFVAPPNYIWLSLDYEGLENWVLAYTAADEELMHVLWNLNLHDENTKMLYNIDKNHSMWKKLRDTAKVYQFGRVAYGGSYAEVTQNMIEKVPECGMTVKKLMKAEEDYRNRFKKVGQWQDETRTLARTKRIARTAFGFVRTLYGNARDIEKHGLNLPIQGGAGYVINQASIRVLHAMRDSRKINRSQFNLQVHDENNCLVYTGGKNNWPGELPYMVDLLEKEMTRPVKFYGVPRPFRVDTEIGPSLGELGKFDRETFQITGKSKHG